MTKRSASRCLRFCALAWAVLALGLSSTAPVSAEDADVERRLLADDWNISLGGFVVDFDTSAQAGSSTILGGLVELEDDLALEPETSTVRLDGFYRFNPKHSIDFGYFTLNRAGTTILEGDVTWNDVLYEIGATVATEFDVDLVRATYRYSFVNNGRTEAGFVAGLSTYSFSAVVDGQATVDDGSGGQIIERRREEAEVLAPIPVAGIFIAHALTPKWILRFNADFFDLETGDFAGRVVDTRVLIDYYFSRHVGVGIGKSTTDIEFSDESENGFAVEYKEDGLLAYLSLVF